MWILWNIIIYQQNGEKLTAKIAVGFLTTKYHSSIIKYLKFKENRI